MISLDKFLVNTDFNKWQLAPVSGIYQMFKDLGEKKSIIEPSLMRYIYCPYQRGSFVLAGKLIGYSLAKLMS